MRTTTAVTLLCLGLVTVALAWKHKHHSSDAPAGPGNFDYYLLALSWAPSYCASHPGDHSRECSTHTAFVLHGLWPQSESGAPPMDCGQASAPSPATVDHMLSFMPSRGLIRHEWSKHGTCSGLSPDDYFQNVERAYSGVRVPESYRTLSHEAKVKVRELEHAFAAENHAPVEAFRTSCHGGELVGLEICLDQQLNYRACSRSVSECSVEEVTVLAPR